MTRRTGAATTAGPTGSRSSASERRAARSSGTDPARRTSKKAARKAARAEPEAREAEAPRRSRAKRGQGDQLREQILDATYELLVETGNADKVSTRAVARRVGCSSPALYLHFADKAALLFATCNRQFLRLGELIAAAVDDVDDPLDALRAAGRAYVTFGVEHAEEYRVMMMVPDMALWNPPISELPTEPGFAVLHGLIARAMDVGILRRDDPTMVALSVWAAFHGIVALRIAKRDFEWPPIDDQIDRMLDIVTRGLTADDDTDAGPRASVGRSGTRRSPRR